IRDLAKKVELTVFPCRPETTDPEGWKYLTQGSAILHPAWSENLMDEWYQSEGNFFLCDLGGDMICWAAERGVAIQGAMEGTTSGIKAIASLSEKPEFRIVDWNSAPLKLEIHNEKMVGFSLWQTFTEVTRLSLHGKSVGVLGYGLVGKGIARTARALGGSVSVYDPDARRSTCASYEGFCCPGRAEVLQSEVVVTSTGVYGALKEEDMPLFTEGAFVLNAGHSEDEIHEAIRDHSSRRKVLEHVEELNPDLGKPFFLLARGRLLNLAAGFGDTINAFDVTSAILVETLADLLAQDS
ncbi:MAG: hypothetical protein KC800_33990, partial [Candidatus Eremiobacteraeota bacterium]|nr:hypothetical protein [Candidatus Eremiobacteraeota bacterium]